MGSGLELGYSLYLYLLIYRESTELSSICNDDNVVHCSCREGVWDPELWYYSEESEKRSASPIENKKKYL